MAKPLDSPASVAIRATLEAASSKPDPVVEFSRKKSPVHATDSFDEIPELGGHGLGDHGKDAPEFPPLRMADLPKIALPRDNRRPLVTADDTYAKQAMEAYKSLRTRVLKLQANQEFRAVAITSVGKSAGKTLTAFNLACCCANVENLNVLLIDGDLRSRSLTKLIGGLPATGLADVMSYKASCEEAICRTDVSNLCVMGAGKSDVSPTELFSREKWSEVIRWSRHHFKIVLVDALSIGEFADFELIAPECDGILLVVRARRTPREALRTAIEQIDVDKPIGIVWNGGEAEKKGLFHS